MNASLGTAMLVASLLLPLPALAQEEEEPPETTTEEAGEEAPEPEKAEEPEAKPEESEEEEEKERTWGWNFNLFAGVRGVDGRDWDPYDDYEELGLEASWGKLEQPLMFATDVYVSRDERDVDDTTVESTTWQFSPGLRRFWVVKKHWVPYAGVGVSYIQADYEKVKSIGVISESDAAWGFWVGGGWLVRLGPHLNLGLATRFELNKRFTVAGAVREGGATNFGLVLGWGSRLQTD